MFRKLISNLPFSPALVGQLGFYAKRLRKEETTRRVGLIFTALALVVQSFAVFQPPESANASSSNDQIPGGFSKLSEFLSAYDRNTNNLRDQYTSMGITRSEIAAMKFTSVTSRDGLYSYGNIPRFSASQGEGSYTFSTSSGTKRTIYYRPLSLWEKDNNNQKITYSAYVGYSKKFGWFGILRICGNLVTKKPPVIPPTPVATCTLLQAVVANRKNVTLTGQAATSGGASVKAYNFSVKDKSGKQVFQKRVASSATSASSGSFTLEPGQYQAALSLETSLGTRTSTNCTKSFTTTATPVCPYNPQLPPDSPNCKAPVAACSNLQLIVSNRTLVQMTGQATVAGGASVKAYNFSIKSADGRGAFERRVATSDLRVALDNVVLSTPGSYTAALNLETSTGPQTSTACTKAFTIAKPEVCQYNPELPVNSPECQPCPDNPELWIKDEKCRADFIKTKTANNITQDKDATKAIAKASDRISYKLSVKNTGERSGTFVISDKLNDVLEYATVSDAGGGNFDKDKKTISWPEITLKPGEEQSRVYTVTMSQQIPASPTGASDSDSYNCIITNTFGNSVNVNVDCPQVKQVEQIVTQLPKTGPGENMLFAGVVLAIVTYFYARSRQLKKEVRLIRRDLNTGAI